MKALTDGVWKLIDEENLKFTKAYQTLPC